jgi:hypothetical protein
VNDHPLAGPKPRRKIDGRFIHIEKVTPAPSWHPGNT